ncbi:T9SS type A sorting domain-containing protein [Lacinutrix mariniflava]|uniref:T9SS type A sorting domain-containing protein n=1 Tax=Lacinutrix mariniflava TaxID=342955 RepID=UPI0006E4336E|nr:T9SS type A sorting domain-containing protein [Lacinutrix mariniflava]
MNSKLLTLLLLLSTSFALAQAGNTLAEAIEITDNNTITLTDAFTGLDGSGMSPHCFGNTLDPKKDLFYFNTIDATHNRINFSMDSQVGVVARIYFQISRAIGGDTNNVVEVVCSFYDINVVPLGGSMSIELPNATYPSGIVNSTDVYYLRIFSPTDQLGVDLDQTTVDAILSNTTVNITSLDSSTLSVTNESPQSINFFTSENKINISNNISFNSYEIYSLDGKKIDNNKENEFIENIDISNLIRGVYILKLSGVNSVKSIKFIKK